MAMTLAQQLMGGTGVPSAGRGPTAPQGGFTGLGPGLNAALSPSPLGFGLGALSVLGYGTPIGAIAGLANLGRMAYSGVSAANDASNMNSLSNSVMGIGGGAGSSGGPGDADAGPGGDGSDSGSAGDGASGAASGDDGSDGSSFYRGGSVLADRLMGPDPKGPDDGYASLNKGEFVISAKAARKYGPDIMRAINAGHYKKSVLAKALLSK